MIRDENGQLAGYVYIDTATRDIGGYVDRAREAHRVSVQLPAGTRCSGPASTEFQVRARERLQILIPIVLFIIFMLLYMTFHSVAEATIVMLSVVYAMTGGVSCSGCSATTSRSRCGSATSRSTAWPCRPAW